MPENLSFIVGLLIVYGVVRFIVRTVFSGGPKPAVAQTRRTKKPSQTTVSIGKQDTKTPWGGPAPDAPPMASAAKPIKTEEPKFTPDFKSVFPGGGSGFRFKTADEIIRQSFGTLSSLKPAPSASKPTRDED